MNDVKKKAKQTYVIKSGPLWEKEGLGGSESKTDVLLGPSFKSHRNHALLPPHPQPERTLHLRTTITTAKQETKPETRIALFSSDPKNTGTHFIALCLIAF